MRQKFFKNGLQVVMGLQTATDYKVIKYTFKTKRYFWKELWNSTPLLFKKNSNHYKSELSISQPAITCSKLIIEALEQSMKHVQS